MAQFNNGYKASSGKKLGIDYSELGNLTKQIKDMDGDVKKTSEVALTKSKQHINKKLHTEMKKHEQTGNTEKSIDETSKPIWIGSSVEIDVGFDISNGGLASIFLMYGTPRMKKDQKLFNAFYGKETSKEIAEIQKEVFEEAIEKMGGK